MNTVYTSKNEIEQIKEKLDLLINQKSEKEKSPALTYLDNADVMRLLKVSRRTLSTWRSDGIISYVQISNKLYYSLADINEMMQRHYQKRFAGKNH